MWCIGELDLPYERIDVGFRFGGTQTREFLKMNPNGTIPVMRDGANPPMWETGAIIRYLAAEYGLAGFWPTPAMDRMLVDQWAEWAKVNVAMNFTSPVFWRVVRTAPAKHDTKAIKAAVAELQSFLQIAETQLGQNDFLAGPHFSVADIQFAHVLFRYFDIQVERPNLPNLRSYYDRISQRPAFIQHVAISYEELRVLD